MITTSPARKGQVAADRMPVPPMSKLEQQPLRLDQHKRRLSAGGLVFAFAGGEMIVDLLASGADRVPLGVPARHPDLAAERGDRRSGDHAVNDLVLVDVVCEPLMVAVTVRQVGPDILLDARVLLGKHLSLAHLRESTCWEGGRWPGCYVLGGGRAAMCWEGGDGRAATCWEGRRWPGCYVPGGADGPGRCALGRWAGRAVRAAS